MVFRNLHGISSFKQIINPPLNLLQARLNSLYPYPFILNYIIGEVESIFDSKIKNIPKFVIISATISDLVLMELMFK